MRKGATDQCGLRTARLVVAPVVGYFTFLICFGNPGCNDPVVPLDAAGREPFLKLLSGREIFRQIDKALRYDFRSLTGKKTAPDTIGYRVAMACGGCAIIMIVFILTE